MQVQGSLPEPCVRQSRCRSSKSELAVGVVTADMTSLCVVTLNACYYASRRSRDPAWDLKEQNLDQRKAAQEEKQREVEFRKTHKIHLEVDPAPM